MLYEEFDKVDFQYNAKYWTVSRLHHDKFYVNWLILSQLKYIYNKYTYMIIFVLSYNFMRSRWPLLTL